MIRAVVYVVGLIVVAALGIWIAEDRGELTQVTIAWLGWRIDTHPGVLILAIAVIAGIVALLYRFLLAVRHLPQGVATRGRERRRRRGYSALSKGMVAVAAGDADTAAREARKADSLLGDPPLTLLLSAQAAQLNGDEDAARSYFEAMLETGETAFLGLRGLLMQAQRAGRSEDALRLARRAYAQRPKTPWVLTTLSDLLTEGGRWTDALPILEEAVKHGALDRAEAERRRLAALLGAAVEADRAGMGGEALRLARRAQKVAPQAPEAVLAVVRLMTEADKARSASRIIRAAWERTPHPELARIYLELDRRAGPADRLTRIEKLVERNPDHVESRIAVAEAALAAERWQTARAALERMADEEPTARICRLWAELEERDTGDMVQVRLWLLRASRAAPDPSWTCGSCGSTSEDWSPACPRCHAIGRIAWVTPEPHATLAFRTPAENVTHFAAAAAADATEPEPEDADEEPPGEPPQAAADPPDEAASPQNDAEPPEETEAEEPDRDKTVEAAAEEAEGDAAEPPPEDAEPPKPDEIDAQRARA